jgi:ATP-dependent Clp protease ATP-binding subunit ClpA
MFERFTEKARRVVFFARYEASQFGSPYIETEHILLGLLRENKALANQFLKQSSAESIRLQIEHTTQKRAKVSTSVDLPLSNECKRVLAYAAEEAERLRHKHIGTEHLLLGLMREENCFAAEILRERGLRLSELRTQMAETPSGEMRAVITEGSSLIEFVDRTGQPLATAQGHLGIVPRVGERVVLGDGDKRKLYTVQELTYEYLPISVTLPTPVHLLQRILVVVAEENGTLTAMGK